MKTIMLRTLVLGVLASSAPVMAQGSQTMTIQTQVPPFCSQLAISSTPMNLGNLTGATGQLTATFASAQESERQLAASFYCNAPSTVTIKAEPLKNTTVTNVADSTSFTNRVDYTASLKWSDLQGSVSSTATDPQIIDAPQANIGELKLSLSNPAVANNLRPVAGDYQGQVRLTIALTQ